MSYSLFNQYWQWRSGGVLVRIDDRYAALPSLLPPDARLGFLSDLPISDDDTGKTVFYETQYVVAPHILLNSVAPRFVIGNLSEPERLAAFCRDFRLVPVATAAPGLVLLAHATEQWPN
ncbi:MAG TPA: hypothetical protein VMW17_23585 [Candidatus Binatia bacterium]|nr:hypothetical protein [Candidatus Binatia bacterium]